MPQYYRAPHPDTLIATHADTGAALYAELQPCPLYVNATLIHSARALDGLTAEPMDKRRVHRLNWIIGERRFVRSSRTKRLGGPILAWANAALIETYPSLEDALGYTAAEVAEIVAEQAAKKAARKKA